MAGIILPFGDPNEDKEVEEEIRKQARIYGLKALEKLKQLGYEWNGEEWYLEGEDSD